MINCPFMDTLVENQSAPWPWPDSLDALIAAPDHHPILLENDRVRVTETKLMPGERTGLHCHKWPSLLYMISFSDFVRYDQDGKPAFDTRTLAKPITAPSSIYYGPLDPHATLNVGQSLLHVISGELKD